MAVKQLLRPTNRRMRWLVGLLLVGLFCIQCIPSNPGGHSTVAIAKNASPADSPQRIADLARADHVALLALCRQRYVQNVRDYTCTLIKQERINGALGDEQEIAVKFLESPFSVAMTWVRNAPLGDKVLYVEGKYDNQMIVRPSNALLRMLAPSVFRKPDGPEAMRNTLRPASTFGFHRGLRDLVAVYEEARKAGDLEQRFGGYATVEGRRAIVLERYLPPKDEYPAWKTLVYIDLEHFVPICIEGYDWQKRLSCRYVYKDIAFNVGLTADDFSPEANGLPLPK